MNLTRKMHARIQKVLSEGPKFDNVFLVGEGKEDPNNTINGPSSARQRNAVSLAGRRWPNVECWLGSFVIFQGIRTSISKKTYIFVILQGGGGEGRTPCPPSSGSAHKMPKSTEPHVLFNQQVIYTHRDTGISSPAR